MCEADFEGARQNERKNKRKGGGWGEAPPLPEAKQIQFPGRDAPGEGSTR